MILQVNQRNGESPDVWAMRAYLKALPEMDDNTVRAMVGWVNSHAAATLRKRKVAARNVACSSPEPKA